jgi:hypothetical protein
MIPSCPCSLSQTAFIHYIIQSLVPVAVSALTVICLWLVLILQGTINWLCSLFTEETGEDMGSYGAEWLNITIYQEDEW